MYRSYEDMPKIRLPIEGEVMLSDSTLRDGSQMPGIVMLKKHRLAIYEFLHKIGIEKLECFLFSDRDKAVAKEMLNINYEFPEVTGWARAVPEDIDLVIAAEGIKETGILMSISESHIFDKLQFKSRDEAMEKYLNAMDYALDHGLRVRCHLEDITRADFDGFIIPFVKEIMSRDKNAIIRLCDTLGLGLPFPDVDVPYGIPKIVQKLKEINVKNIETHTHDDFGMGMVNSLAGYWYGANWSNMTFLGIGERAGNAELEKMLMFLITRVEGFQKYNPECLTEFARYMEKKVRLPIPRNKSIVGKNIFAHESGIHTAGVIKNPFTYEPFSPDLIGAERKLMIGDSSGTEVIRLRVEEVLNDLMDLVAKVNKKDHRIVSIYKDIRKLYDVEGRRSCISDDEMKKYVEKYFLFDPVIDEVKLDENGDSNGI